MREILFRGKRLDNGEWVYGYPLIDNADCTAKKEGKCVCAHDGSLAEMWTWVDESHEYDYVDVDPATIGQYTGLKDMNGVKIFEGDVLHGVYGLPFQVIFEDGAFMWLNGYRSDFLYQSICDACRVMGNIHDKEDEE